MHRMAVHVAKAHPVQCSSRLPVTYIEIYHNELIHLAFCSQLLISEALAVTVQHVVYGHRRLKQQMIDSESRWSQPPASLEKTV